MARRRVGATWPVRSVGLVAQHLKPGMFHEAGNVSDGAFRRLAQKVDLELLARVARADCHGRSGSFDCSAMDWFIERARALGVEHQPPKPLVMGRHLVELGVSPGPRMGEIPKQVYERSSTATCRRPSRASMRHDACSLSCTRSAVQTTIMSTGSRQYRLSSCGPAASSSRIAV